MFIIIGLYLYTLYEEKNKKIYLLLGSILMSLGIFSRPNMIVVSLMGLFIVFDNLRKNIINLIYYIIPYLVIGLIMMYMNYMRFDNIFEFGQAYQLTLIDSSYYDFSIVSILNGIYSYILKPPLLTLRFPYILNNLNILEYSGFYFNTSNGNGIIPMSLIALMIPFIYKKDKKSTNKFMVLCIMCGLILLIISNMRCGSMKRYSLEFTWLFLIPIIITVINNIKHKEKILLILIIISCVINFLVIFDTEHDDTNAKLDDKYTYKIQY